LFKISVISALSADFVVVNTAYLLYADIIVLLRCVNVGFYVVRFSAVAELFSYTAGLQPSELIMWVTDV